MGIGYTAASIQLLALAESRNFNKYFINNPKIDFFHVVYRKHTNFSIDHIKNTWVNNFTNTTTETTVKIDRSGSLISKIWIDAYFPSVTSTNSPTFLSWCNNTGHAYLKSCELTIGGSNIDKHDSIFMDIYNELTDVNEMENMGLNKHQTNLYMKSGTSNIAPELQLYIPLKFYFNRNIGSAVPIVALQYHDIELKFQFRKLAELLVSDKKLNTNDSISDPTVNLWVETIFLDTEEQKRIVNKKHEYLIEQIQMEEHNVSSNLFDMNFSKPVKQLFWVFSYINRTTSINLTENSADPSIFYPKQYNDNGTVINGIETINGNDFFNYQVNATDSHGTSSNNAITAQGSGSCIFLNKTLDHFNTATIKFQSDNRLENQKALFYRYLQPLYYGNKIPEKHIYTYSFALTPYDSQPSGLCNFSKIHDIRLSFDTTGPINDDRKIHIYAINYNILEIEQGSALLKFAN
jgi:hypothetical protein